MKFLTNICSLILFWSKFLARFTENPWDLIFIRSLFTKPTNTNSEISSKMLAKSKNIFSLPLN